MSADDDRLTNIIKRRKMTQKIKSIIMRFVKGFVAGGLSSIATLATFNGSTWQDVANWLGIIMFSFVVGGISGVLLGAEKWLTWEEPNIQAKQ